MSASKGIDASLAGNSTSTTGLTEFTKRQPNKGQLLVKVYTPFYTFYEGDAQSLSAVNETGLFDILPGHHNFITMLQACDIVIKTSDDQAEIPIVRGLLHIKKDKLTVFLDV
jgi:F0F1-type ATP synthase epsilon subunit